MADPRSVDVVVSGLVQGVGYRFWTRRRARALGLSGSVRNRPDGTVAATFSGTAEAVADMIAACEAGPPGARVESVSVAERRDGPVPSGFEIVEG